MFREKKRARGGGEGGTGGGRAGTKGWYEN